MNYDLIIVARSSCENLRRVTQQTIDTARADCDLNVILIETSGIVPKYNGVNEVIMYREPFCYNRALNHGIARATGDIHILANNDLVFRPGWSVIGQQMIDNGVESASALSEDPRQRIYPEGDWYYPGYDIGLHLTGWCIFVTKECIAKIGKLDESFDFWYSDNMYAEQIMRAGVRHGLFCNVRVDHVTSVTLKTLSPRDQRKFSFLAKNKYLKNAV